MDEYHFFEEVGAGRRSTVLKARKKHSIEFLAVKRLPKAVMKQVSVLAAHSSP